MELGLLLPLVALALIDSTSFGTLGIPVWLLAQPKQIKPGRILLFLSTVAGFYFVLGVVLYLGAESLRDSFESLADATPARVIAFAAGVVLLILGLTIEPWTPEGKKAKREREAKRRAERGPGRMERWRHRMTDGNASSGSVMGLAVLAAGIEAISMLPYLAAIGLLVAAKLAVGTGIAVLAGYCVVMIAPALVLLALRISLHHRILPVLKRIDQWMSRNSKETLAWIFALLGLWLISNNLAAVQSLFE